MLAIALAFVLGILFQEFGELIDKRYLHIKHFVLYNYLKKSHDGIIDNEAKLKIYRKNARAILKKDKTNFGAGGKEFTDYECAYVYAKAFYFIENKNKAAKYEKMRAIGDFCRSMIGMLVVVMILDIIHMVLILLECYKAQKPYLLLMFLLICIILFLAFKRRMLKVMKRKARILMGTYDSCKENDENL